MTSRRRQPVVFLAAAAALIGGVPSRAHAQDARLVAIADPDARAAVGSLIVAAERQGLPREPLVTKALEGVEKGAPGPRIEAAVRAMTARLVTARAALSTSASPAELLAGADALSAGVAAKDIASVRAVARDRSIAVALGVLAQLAARGVPSPNAAAAVGALVHRGATPSQLLALQRAVQDDLAIGVDPAKALTLRARAVIAALPPPGPPVSAGAATLSPGKP